MIDTTGLEPAIAETPVVETPKGADPAPAAIEPNDKPDKVQERFDKLTRDKYNERRRADKLEFELQQLRQQSRPPQSETAPTLESVGFDQEKFNAATLKHIEKEAGRLATAKAEEILTTKENERTEGERVKAFQSKALEFSKSKPDYHEVVVEGGERGDWACSNKMAALIKSSELGPQLAYHLATNPDVSQKIFDMPEDFQAYALGKIEAKLELPKAPPPVSKAPPPPPKLDASEPDTEKNPSDMTDKEFAKWRGKQIAQRRG